MPRYINAAFNSNPLSPVYVRNRTDIAQVFTDNFFCLNLYQTVRMPPVVDEPRVLATFRAVENDLLCALPPDIFERWLPSIERMELISGQVLYEPGSTLKYLYFPISSIVSLLYVMENGSSASIAAVGKEGLVGIALVMGSRSTPSRAVVQSAGAAFRIAANVIEGDLNQSGPVLHLMLRYAQALITQMSLTAACNRHHSIDQQLCRWLLLSHDRLTGNNLVMTQELIANMLGVRREGVTEAAIKLQKSKVIQYTRGRITVLSRGELELRTCECYAVVKREYDRLLTPRFARDFHRHATSTYITN